MVDDGIHLLAFRTAGTCAADLADILIMPRTPAQTGMARAFPKNRGCLTQKKNGIQINGAGSEGYGVHGSLLCRVAHGVGTGRAKARPVYQAASIMARIWEP